MYNEEHGDTVAQARAKERAEKRGQSGRSRSAPRRRSKEELAAIEAIKAKLEKAHGWWPRRGGVWGDLCGTWLRATP